MALKRLASEEIALPIASVMLPAPVCPCNASQKSSQRSQQTVLLCSALAEYLNDIFEAGCAGPVESGLVVEKLGLDLFAAGLSADVDQTQDHEPLLRICFGVETHR